MAMGDQLQWVNGESRLIPVIYLIKPAPAGAGYHAYEGDFRCGDGRV